MLNANFLLWFVLASTLQGAQTLAAANHLHPAPLPIPNATYGNIDGCLLLHGDEPDGAPLWLTPHEVGSSNLQCVIESWQHDANGLVSFDCGAHRYLVFPPTIEETWFTVIERVDRLNFSTYKVAQCGPE
jgi:hypothetical protein